jgi:hypothetical protein
LLAIASIIGGWMSKSNVIDLKPLLQNAKKKNQRQHAKMTAAPIIDMEQKREELFLKEQRNTKRTILSEFVGAFIVLPTNGPSVGGLQKVNLYDISDDGVSFDMDPNVGQLRVGEELAMRIYLSQKNYFSFTVKVANLRFERDEEVYRHGCQFLKNSVNKEALYHFVKFIESVALNLKIDVGDKLTQNSKR